MEKFPSSILIVALNPQLQLDNQQFYRHVLADELRKTGAVDGFLRNSLSFVTIQYNDDVVENQHLVQVPFRRIRR
jgi:hypothetical protein